MTPEKARELFDYEPDSGRLQWKRRVARWMDGTESAGSVKSDGYVVITYKRKGYPAHRIAWAIHYGKWPDTFLDHINGNRADNRIENLREATRALNMQNQRAAMKSNKSSGVLGVHYFKQTSRWRATICIDGKNRHLGYYATSQEASDAYIEHKRKLHQFGTL
jgi:hypothetical protein